MPDSDYVAEAVSIAKAINGRAPVKLVWTREDDMSAGRYRPMSYHVLEGARRLPYTIPNLQVDLATVEGVGVPVLWWRSVGHTHDGYVTEAFFDELAASAGTDPYEMRRALLANHPRHRAVLELAAEKAGWGDDLGQGRGRGIAMHESFGSFVAEVVDVTVSDDGSFTVAKVTCAVDCGIAINPDVIRAQTEGGIGYALSAALR